VAFENDDGTWTAGAIEGTPEEDKSWKNFGGLGVLPGGSNGGWYETVETREDVEKTFSELGYNKIKIISVDKSNSESANKIIEEFENAGYAAPLNDCLTQTDNVLRAYGVNTYENTFGVISALTWPFGGAAARITADVVPNVYFFSLQGEEKSLDSNNAQVDQSSGDKNDLGGINFTSIRLNYISVSTDSSGVVNFDLALEAQKSVEGNSGINPINSTLIGAIAFMTGLAIPNDKFWVNLAPWEPDRIIDDELKQSEVGRIMLEADLQMKRDFSNYTNPCASEIGKEYWMFLDGKREILVQQCMRKFPGEIKDRDNVYFRPVTRHWIVPDKVYAYTNGSEIYIINATLTISSDPVIDHAYFLVNNQDVRTLSRGCQEELNRSAIEFSQYVKELSDSMILPYVVADVNHADKYEDLRNVYFALALAQWYKSCITSQRDIFRQSLDSSGSSAFNGEGSWSPYEIWENYVHSFENGDYKCWENTTIETAKGIRTRSQLRSSGGVSFYNINDNLVDLGWMPTEVKDMVTSAIEDSYIDKGADVLFGIRLHGDLSHDNAALGSGSLETAIRRDPNLAIAWINKGNKFCEQGNYNGAIEAYDEAIRLDPQSASAWLGKGVALYWQMKDSEALRCFDEAIRLNPDFAAAWNNKGIILEELGRASEADAAYSRARELG